MDEGGLKVPADIAKELIALAKLGQPVFGQMRIPYFQIEMGIDEQGGILVPERVARLLLRRLGKVGLMDTRDGRIINDKDFLASIPLIERKFFRPMQIPPTPQQQRRRPPRVGRNDLCPCGSGKKFKRCCLVYKVTPIAARMSGGDTGALDKIPVGITTG